jgi:hypothetical protein
MGVRHHAWQELVFFPILENHTVTKKDEEGDFIDTDVEQLCQLKRVRCRKNTLCFLLITHMGLCVSAGAGLEYFWKKTQEAW